MNCVQDIFDVIKDYQSLIAGILAVLAAAVAARPVWKQLDRMEFQSNATFREFLLVRMREIEAHQQRITEPMFALSRELSEPMDIAGEDARPTIEAEWAHREEQRVQWLLDMIDKDPVKERAPTSVQAALKGVTDDLESLEELLRSIHRPASMDQNDEDNPLTDEEWAEVQAESARAEGEFPGACNQFSRAAASLEKAFAHEIVNLRQRIASVDQLLLDR